MLKVPACVEIHGVDLASSIRARDKDPSMPSATLQQLADLVQGRIVAANPELAGGLVIDNALPLQDAVENCITLCDHPKHTERLNNARASAVVVTQPLESCEKPMLVVDKLHAAFTAIIQHIRPVTQLEASGVHPSAVVHESAEIGKNTTIHAGVVVSKGVVIGDHCSIGAGTQIMEGCRIGDGTTLFPSVTLYAETEIGRRVLVHSGVVLGAYGFGYRQEDGKHVRTAQLGWVKIEDDVEIGAGATVDRGTYGPTRIGEGTKIDNQVQIGHNCQIGKHNLICSQVGIAGSTSTGDYVVLAGQVGVADHLHLDDRVIVSAQSGVMHNLEADSVVFGTPASPIKRRMVEVAMTSKLPQMRQELRALQKKVDALSNAINAMGEEESQADEASARSRNLAQGREAA